MWWDDIVQDEDEESEPDGNWFCPNELCHYYNYSFRQVCRWCRTHRPVNSENFQPQPDAMEQVFHMWNGGQLNLLTGDVVNDFLN